MTIEAADEQFVHLLTYIRDTRGFDFTGYKKNSLLRRIQRRMQALQVSGFEEYKDHLEVHPDEYALLFDTILINVTSFFRDRHVWEYIEKEVIPGILAKKGPDEALRIWCAGVSSGEEAYTIAMLLAGQIGVEAFKRRVKIYATDVDESALSKARMAIYSARDIESVPPEHLDRYFERMDGSFVFHKELRRNVIFGRHDIIQDAPISRIDLLICRNLMMYFNAEVQARVLARLHYALNDEGYLFLGKAEMLLSHAALFSPIDLKMRIFSRVPNQESRRRTVVGTIASGGTVGSVQSLQPVVQVAFESSTVAQVVVNKDGNLAMANERARKMYAIAQDDVGKPFRNLKLSYRPVELLGPIENVQEHGEPVIIKEVLWNQGEGGERYLDIVVNALLDHEKTYLGVNISFIDMTDNRRMQMELEHTNHELETAMEELESANEEAETTNEELQSTIEELETTNEELQSTNEELETMNEELQSTNEELETMNDEMTQRSNELNQLNAFFNSVLASIPGGVIVLNKSLLVEVWNPMAQELWGLRREEVLEHNFFGLDIGLPIDRLRAPIRSIISGEEDQYECRLVATNRRGRKIELQVTITPLVDQREVTQGVILIMEQFKNEGDQFQEAV
jgi:two-component system CheB/CheR fusion protein